MEELLEAIGIGVLILIGSLVLIILWDRWE